MGMKANPLHGIATEEALPQCLIESARKNGDDAKNPASLSSDGTKENENCSLPDVSGHFMSSANLGTQQTLRPSGFLNSPQPLASLSACELDPSASEPNRNIRMNVYKAKQLHRDENFTHNYPMHAYDRPGDSEYGDDDVEEEEVNHQSYPHYQTSDSCNSSESEEHDSIQLSYADVSKLLANVFPLYSYSYAYSDALGQGLGQGHVFHTSLGKLEGKLNDLLKAHALSSSSSSSSSQSPPLPSSSIPPLTHYERVLALVADKVKAEEVYPVSLKPPSLQLHALQTDLRKEVCGLLGCLEN